MKTTSAGESASPVDQLSGFQRALLPWRLLTDQRVATWIKAAVPLIALAYVLMPVDLIPDFILGVGQVDDIGIVGIALFAMTRMLPRLAPNAVVNEHIEELTGKRPRGTAKAEQRQSVIEPAFIVVDEDRTRNRSTGTTKDQGAGT